MFQVPPKDTTETFLQPVELSYRHVDAAKGYPDEAEVGHAVPASASTAPSSSSRRSAPTTITYDAATRAPKTSLGQLEMEYVNLYLIHWPVPSRTATWRSGGR